MKKFFMTLAILMVGAIGFTSCGDDEEVQPSQNEEKDQPENPVSTLVGRRFIMEENDLWEYVDQDNDTLNLYTTRSIQFLNDSVALMCTTSEYVYPQHPDWYSLDYGFFYLECKFDNKTDIGTLTFKKMTVIMTGYYNENVTIDEEEPYTVWTFKIDPEGKGIILPDDEEPYFMKEVDPIKGLQWQEFPPENGETDILPEGMLDRLKSMPIR